MWSPNRILSVVRDKALTIYFFAEMSLVCMLVALSVLLLCLRSSYCEEKTAYFKLLFICYSSLLPAPVS